MPKLLQGSRIWIQVNARCSSAVDAHLNGNSAAAIALFRQANLPEVWDWLNPAWTKTSSHVRFQYPHDNTKSVPKTERDPNRYAKQDTKRAVLARDGYRCRYCGIPVVASEIRDITKRLYPDAIPWGRKASEQHAGFQCLWLQYDHVVPHSHGGSSSEENVVVSCALCNFGKDEYTLKQLGISDPRLRNPEKVPWDGLERLRGSHL
jgi:5-methylcytosine-specific restriction endonuclease McrA